MNIKLNITDRQLCELLDLFFDEQSQNNRVWDQTKTGALIKNKVSKAGHWTKKEKGFVEIESDAPPEDDAPQF